MSNQTIIIQSEGLGRGEERLGTALMANFLRLLGESEDKPRSLVFWNTGVRLVCEGSPVLDHVRRLADQGVPVLACTTCLEYFNLMDKMAVGKPTTMAASIRTILGGDVVTL